MYLIGLIYDRQFTAWAVRTALSSVPELDVHILSEQVSRTRPARDLDVLITDQPDGRHRPGVNATQVLLMTPTDPPTPAELAARGFDGCLSERFTPAQLATAVQAAAQAEPDRSPASGVPLRLVADNSRSDTALSDRERQVLRLIAEGYTHDQTARRLGISPHTVNTYVKRVKGKLGVGNKAELARVALVSGW
ncbi:helix-turn-helix transcriptional regulator [Streptacidiphilus jiangxiensis]|uniref:DNA-binding response regulator, NarL/FixJ family, contains REC and HTH domains n=1 Tax=Streptacidiphilus jiangxiensis TaxID=235985 RepID=A0A1H7Y3J4_STRJI|nr:helix-turn-helix transcriptional regulator [Streptacidiphilus jiangxiensis]SEM40495.1 DNA-binding response regulator, NarL/FixJ family, contains REC and HTH domains [Streptacidiphilus jiangxiensis]